MFSTLSHRERYVLLYFILIENISNMINIINEDGRFSQVRFPASPSRSGETLSRGPVFLDALKREPLSVEPSGAPGHKNHKTINPPGQF